MIEMKAVAELCTINQLTELWNRGFEGYYIDVTMNNERMIKKLAGEDISLDHSVVAIVDGTPAGFVLNSYRVLDGRTEAWNAGTGIIKDMRGQGIGQELMSEVFRIYREQGVERGRLESIFENKRAISLYESQGYRTVDTLLVMRGTEDADSQQEGQIGRLKVERTAPAKLSSLSFYNWNAPWQMQYPSIPDGDAYIAYGDDGECVGYTLCKSSYNAAGTLVSTGLFQCQLKEDLTAERKDFVMEQLLLHTFRDAQPTKRYAVNIPVSDKAVVKHLRRFGLRTVTRQVHMFHNMEE